MRWRQRPPARASSSSGRGISASIPIRAPGKPVFNRTVTLKDLAWAAEIQRSAVSSTFHAPLPANCFATSIATGSVGMRSDGHGRRHVQFVSPTVAG